VEVKGSLSNPTVFSGCLFILPGLRGRSFQTSTGSGRFLLPPPRASPPRVQTTFLDLPTFFSEIEALGFISFRFPPRHSGPEASYGRLHSSFMTSFVPRPWDISHRAFPPSPTGLFPGGFFFSWATFHRVLFLRLPGNLFCAQCFLR